MYNTSKNYKEYIKKPSRNFECKVTIGNRTFNNEDIIKITPSVAQPNNGFAIGSTISQSIEITLRNDGGVYASVGVAVVEIGLNINGNYEYVPMGTFYIDDVVKTDYTVKLTCYDNMIKFEIGYFSSLGDNPTLQQVVDELASITGVEFTGTVPGYTVTKLQGFTCREVLGYVASVCGGNAYITRDGKFTILYPKEVDCAITAENYFTYKLEDQEYKIGMVTCQNKSNSNDSDSGYDSSNDQNTISIGSLSTDTMELGFENPWVNTTILNDIYNKLKDFSYLGYTLKWQGDLSLDPMDIVTIVDKNNAVRKALIFANKLTYVGGLIAETSSTGETKNSNKFSANGPATKNIERLSVKLLIAEKALINKATIQDLQATNVRIETLDASVATINSAFVNYAKIDQLDATNANVTNLNANVAKISDALINKANIADLQAANANITSLNSTVANIQTLVNGNLTSANIQSLVLSSDKVTVENGFIKNAMIESLTVDKIRAGTINTNVINLASANGGLTIAGATQQFKDKNNNVRMQVGQDATGEFSFILKGKDGTSTLIDETGVHEGAIADGLIKTDMLTNAAVTSDKIDYESVFNGFNSDTNTHYIKSSKIQIGLENQTLDIAFNNMSTKVEGVKTTTDNNTTSISAIQGQISTLISNTTITKDGVTTQLKDAYNGTVETINSIDTIIGDHTSYINSATGQVESVSSKLTSMRADLDSIELSITNTQTNLNSTNSQLATLQLSVSGFDSRISASEANVTNAISDLNATKSEVNQSINDITQTVQSVQNKTTSLEESINNSVASLSTGLDGITGKVTTLQSSIKDLEVGSRNYILASNFQDNIYKNYWDLNSCNNIETYDYNNYSYNSLVCNNTTDNWLEAGQCIDSLKSNKQYTFSAMCYGAMTISICEVIYNSTTNTNDYIYTEIEIENSDYERVVKNFTTHDNVRYGYINIATPRDSISKVALLKLEWGNIVSDWSPAPEDTEGMIQETFSTAISEIDILKGSIQTKVSIDEVGTIITQSPTQVMTAFNNISKYFQVSPDGAKFGDLANGDYTIMSSDGLMHWDGATKTPYFYTSYTGTALIEMKGVTTKSVTIAFPDSLKKQLKGKIPKGIASVCGALGGSDYLVSMTACLITNITSTSITITVWQVGRTLMAITTSSGGSSPTYSTTILPATGANDGAVEVTYLLIG